MSWIFFLGHFIGFWVFCQFRGFVCIFGHLRFQGFFFFFFIFQIWGYFGQFQFFCSLQRILGHFGHLSDVKVYFSIILDVLGILIIHEVLRFDRSFQSFLVCFGHLRGCEVILVILEIWGYFGQLRGFRGFSFLFFFFWVDVLWLWGYFGNFRGILAILVISRVFLSKFSLLEKIY